MTREATTRADKERIVAAVVKRMRKAMRHNPDLTEDSLATLARFARELQESGVPLFVK